MEMRALAILALAFLVTAGMIARSFDRCTDDCRGGFVFDDGCADTDSHDQPQTDHDDKHDNDAPCSPFCPNCARPALVALPTLAMPTMVSDVATADVTPHVTLESSPSLCGLFRPPRAASSSPVLV